MTKQKAEKILNDLYNRYCRLQVHGTPVEVNRAYDEYLKAKNDLRQYIKS